MSAKMFMLSKGYLACAFETKGRINLRVDKGYLYPYVSIRSTNKRWLEKLKEMFPKFRGPSSVSKSTYGLFIYNLSDIKEFLELIYDDLTISKPDVQRILDYIEAKSNGAGTLRLLQILEGESKPKLRVVA